MNAKQLSYVVFLNYLHNNLILKHFRKSRQINLSIYILRKMVIYIYNCLFFSYPIFILCYCVGPVDSPVEYKVIASPCQVLLWYS